MKNNTINIGILLLLSTNIQAEPENTNNTEYTEIALRDRNILEEMVVTGTREERLKKETAESITAFTAKDIADISPSHPAELLNRVAGVHINNLGGEGHMSSIRQPISTGPDYLFLEDSIPTRPTGFFNHNGLYEINIPQSGQIEVIKGPGSALYGSGAFGGIINALTKKSPDKPEANVDIEIGKYGWSRLLIGGGSPIKEKHGLRADINMTDNEGYRDYSEYSRSSLNIRLDDEISDSWTAKTIVSYTQVDQSGVSDLVEEDYKNNPQKNTFRSDIGYREVEALRLSSEFNRTIGKNGLSTATLYYRDNTMKMMPSWMVTYDPNIRDYQFESYGLMLKHRQNILHNKGKIIIGIDTDSTPSQYKEHSITILPEQPSWMPRDFYEEYKQGELNYNFDAEQTSFSPYIHTEWALADKWLMNMGVRYDTFEVDYTDKLPPAEINPETNEPLDTRHRRPDSQTINYNEASPKWSLIYQISDKHMSYVNYRHAFVSPSVGTLFRPGSSKDSDKIKPTTADSIELGFRGIVNDYLTYEIAYYEMDKQDAVVSYIEGGTRWVTNAGETSHKGIELTLQGNLTDQLSYNLAWTRREQKYVEFQYVWACFNDSCGGPLVETRDYAGKKMGRAPEQMGSLSFVYEPDYLPKTRFEIEMDYMGEYYTDETNNNRYDGHKLFNIRASYDITNDVTLQLRLLNATDKLYSTYTSNQVTSSTLGYRPGLPRTAYLSLKVKF